MTSPTANVKPDPSMGANSQRKRVDARSPRYCNKPEVDCGETRRVRKSPFIIAGMGAFGLAERDRSDRARTPGSRTTAIWSLTSNIGRGLSGLYGDRLP